MSDHAWCTVAMAKTNGGTWEVVAQLAGWGSADLWQEAAETPPHAEGADAESPAGFLCDRLKGNAIMRAGWHSDIFLFYDHNLIKKKKRQKQAGLFPHPADTKKNESLSTWSSWGLIEIWSENAVICSLTNTIRAATNNKLCSQEKINKSCIMMVEPSKLN